VSKYFVLCLYVVSVGVDVKITGASAIFWNKFIKKEDCDQMSDQGPLH